jgi:methionyl-tRNA formyltransferase
MTASAIKEAALALGVPVAQPVTLKTAEGRSPLAQWYADLMVVVAYGLILPPEALNLPRFGCINIHASLLPRWRGAAPVQRAILAGDEETGITLMQMDAGLDTGPMLLARATPVGAQETSGELSARLSVLGAAAMLECIEQLACGRADPRPQPALGATYAAKISKAEGLIDWGRDAASIARQVRAFNPWPAAETRFDGEPVKVLRASADADPSPNRSGLPDTGAPMSPYGQILGVEGDGMRVRCAQGTLLVGQVQRAGRRAVLAREFVASSDAIGKQLG